MRGLFPDWLEPTFAGIDDAHLNLKFQTALGNYGEHTFDNVPKEELHVELDHLQIRLIDWDPDMAKPVLKGHVYWKAICGDSDELVIAPEMMAGSGGKKRKVAKSRGKGKGEKKTKSDGKTGSKKGKADTPSPKPASVTADLQARHALLLNKYTVQAQFTPKVKHSSENVVRRPRMAIRST
ncbi:hypothetical protein LTR95_001739 [Oleoguttula sp. CCFEE 5521]